MKIVIDTNKVIAALIKDGIARKIISSVNFKFITPDHTISEILKHRDEIREKANINHEEFGILLSLIFEKIEVISEEYYKDFIEESKKLISDIDDVPFIALCLATNSSGIWSDDKHFQEQNVVRIFETIDMKRFL